MAEHPPGLKAKYTLDVLLHFKTERISHSYRNTSGNQSRSPNTRHAANILCIKSRQQELRSIEKWLIIVWKVKKL